MVNIFNLFSSGSFIK